MFWPTERKQVVIESERFGRISVEPDMVISLIDGGNGSGKPRAFVLLGLGRLSPFLFLVSVDSPNTAYAIIDPLTILPDYHPSIDREDIRMVGDPGTDAIQIITVVEIDRERKSATLDLKHPILINVKGKVAKQLELKDSPESYEIPVALLRQ